jgi:uncharacterized protein (TIGR02147 family)
MNPTNKPSSDQPVEKPDIYGYHDYRLFLNKWMAYLKHTIGEFNVRKLAKLSQVSESYLSMVLSGERSLSEVQLAKILPHLNLDISEKSYLEWLRMIVETADADERLEALKKIQRFRQYREMNPLEVETYQYLTNWHYVVIRELTALPDFRADAKWIQTRLKIKVPLNQIKRGIEFLVQHGFVQLNTDGSANLPDKRIHCKTGVLRPALTQFHREMLTLACDSIENTPSEERNISAHTCAIPIDRISEAKRILDEARRQIIELSNESSSQPDTIYHFGFLAFPLTKRTGDKK